MKTLSLMIGVLMGGLAIVTGCDGKCSGTYNCPAGIPRDSISTTTLPSALVEVSADAPCTATLVPGDGSAASVQVIDDAFNEPDRCRRRRAVNTYRAGARHERVDNRVAASVTVQRTTILLLRERFTRGSGGHVRG